MAEHRLHTAGVVGSIPIAPTISSTERGRVENLPRFYSPNRVLEHSGLGSRSAP